MSLLAQEIIVAVLVAVCLGHLLWRGWQILRGGKTGCGGCGSCPSQGAQAGDVVSLETLRQSAKRN